MSDKTLVERLRRLLKGEYPSRGDMFQINRFRDGDDIGLPSWARHIVIGGFCEQGWNAYDQRAGGRVIATGDWGDYLTLLPDGRIVGPAAQPSPSEETPDEQ
jgi:hypothetical protein